MLNLGPPQIPVDGSKQCTKCDETKPLDGFTRDKRGKYGRHNWCKKCCDEYNRRRILNWEPSPIPVGAVIECPKCGETKPLDDFHRKRGGKYGRKERCKKCVREYSQADNGRYYRERGGKEKNRNRDLMKKYGITLEEYNERHEKQGGMCAMCREPETSMFKGTLRTLAVDHDKVTGIVRELLCLCCNIGIGMFNHDPHLLEAARQYMEKHNGVQKG